MRLITLVVLTVAMIALTSSAQGPYDDPKPLPEQRAADTYSVYEAALPKPIWGGAYRGEEYYIVDRAIKPNSGWRPEQCMHPPEELRVKVGEMLDDLAVQAHAYTLETRLKLTKPYQFVSNDPAERRDAAGNKLPAGTKVIQLGIVSFSKDHSLASVVVWTRGGSQWRVFKRGENGWEEQRWAVCGAVI